MSENHFEREFQCLSGLHKGLVLLKDLPNPWRPNRTYMSLNRFENIFRILRVQYLMELRGY